MLLTRKAVTAQEAAQRLVARLGDHAAAIERARRATTRHRRRLDDRVHIAGISDDNCRHAVVPDPALDDLECRFVLVDVDLAILYSICFQEALCAHQVRTRKGPAENDEFFVHSSSTMPRFRYRRSCQTEF